MAFVATSTQQISVTFEDRDQNQSAVSFFAPSAAIAANVETFAKGTLATNLVALSDASIRRITISHTFDNDAFVQPVESCDIERKGVWTWNADDRTVSKNEIPSIKNTLVLDGTNIINPLDAAVTTFVAMMVDAGLFDVYGMGNYRGVKLRGLKNAAHKIHRASSRG